MIGALGNRGPRFGRVSRRAVGRLGFCALAAIFGPHRLASAGSGLRSSANAPLRRVDNRIFGPVFPANPMIFLTTTLREHP